MEVPAGTPGLHDLYQVLDVPLPVGSQDALDGKVLKVDSAGLSPATSTAPAGHTAAQWPQLRDSVPVTAAFFPFMVIVSLGHTSTQSPHPVQSSSSIFVVTVLSMSFYP